MDQQTGIETLIEEIEELAEDLEHHTILYNDEFHVFDDVVIWVKTATGKTIEEAYSITLEAHINGRAICYSGDKSTCEGVANILRGIGLIVEVD